MYELARLILQKNLFENKTVTIDELKNLQTEKKEKLPVFVTVYNGDTIVGSSGKIFPTNETVFGELIDNTLWILQDPRFLVYKTNPEKVRSLHYRVDIYRESDRRLLHHPDDLDSKTEGMIILCQKQWKVWCILPHMLSAGLSGEDVYHRLVEKIDLNMHEIGKWDIIIYGFKTESFTDKVA